MNYDPEFDNNTFDSGVGKKVNSYFSRLGLGIFLMLAVTSVLQILAASVVKSYFPELASYDWFVWALSLVPMYLFGLPVFLLVTRRVPAAPPEKHKLQFSHLLLLVLMGYAIMYAGSYIGNMLMLVINSITGRDASNAIANMLMNSNFIINAVVAVIIAPLAEEFIFRKILIDRTRAYGEKTAIIFSALMFGLYHGNLFQFFYAFGVGLLLAFVYTRTGKLRYPVIIHAAFNFFSGVLSSLVLKMVDFNALTEIMEKIGDPSYLHSLTENEAAMNEFLAMISPHLPGLIVYVLYTFLILGAALAGLILLLMHRNKFILKPAEFQLPHDRIGSTVYFNVGVALAIIGCLVLMVMSLL